MMGRKRKYRKDLPERVYQRHGAFYFVSKSGEWTWLGREVGVALRQYATIVQTTTTGKIASIMDRYMREIAPAKAPRTLLNNELEIEPLRKVFGHMNPDDVTPQDIYAYRNLRPKIAANREIALLSSVFSHAIEWGLAKSNPCRLVRRNKETPRKRAVEWAEFQIIYQRASQVIQCMMDIAIITGLRLGDLLKLNERENIKKEGLYVETGKTGTKILFLWTDELKAAVDRARGLRGSVRSLTLISNQQGQRYTVSGFQTLWHRLMMKALADKAIPDRFQFRDLRAMAADLSDNPTSLLGHDDPRTTARYRRAPRRVIPNAPVR